MPHPSSRADPDLQYAALQERVYGLGQQFLNFEQATTRGFQQVETAIAALSTEVRAGGKTQWQTIVTAVGVLVTILGAIGTLAYLPVKSGMEANTAEVRLLRENIVPRPEHLERWRRAEDDFRMFQAELRRHEDRVVSRPEHDQALRAADRRFAELQRQVDELKGLRRFAGDQP